MRCIVALAILLINEIAFSDECTKDKYDTLAMHIENNSLDEPSSGKMQKFTHHDYSLSCSLNYGGNIYKWYTDYKGVRYIIKLEDGENSKYYGLFSKKVDKL